MELQKNAEWFLKGVGGPGAQKGDVKAVTVLQDLRDAFLKLEPAVEPAVAEHESQVEGDDDSKPANAYQTLMCWCLKSNGDCRYLWQERQPQSQKVSDVLAR